MYIYVYIYVYLYIYIYVYIYICIYIYTYIYVYIYIIIIIVIIIFTIIIIVIIIIIIIVIIVITIIIIIIINIVIITIIIIIVCVYIYTYVNDMYTSMTPIWSHAQFSPQKAELCGRGQRRGAATRDRTTGGGRAPQNWRKTTGEVDRNLQNPRENMEKYGAFHKWEIPKMVGLQGKILHKWMIWGYPHFRTPLYIYIWKNAAFRRKTGQTEEKMGDARWEPSGN